MSLLMQNAAESGYDFFAEDAGLDEGSEILDVVRPSLFHPIVEPAGQEHDFPAVGGLEFG